MYIRPKCKSISFEFEIGDRTVTACERESKAKQVPLSFLSQFILNHIGDVYIYICSIYRVLLSGRNGNWICLPETHIVPIHE